jgi:hypothetical protein
VRREFKKALDASVNTTASVSILASRDLWLRWVNIALRHTGLADEAASRIAETDHNDQPKFGNLMVVELEHSMIALDGATRRLP